MALAADKSAAEGRWVSFDEFDETVVCTDPLNCTIPEVEESPEEAAVKSAEKELEIARVAAKKAKTSTDVFGRVVKKPKGSWTKKFGNLLK